jgi:hypothetical protein
VRGAAPFLLFLAFPVVAVLAYRSWQQEQKRRAQLLQWATANGYGYAAEDDSLCSRWSSSPFGQGDNRRATNAVTGRHGDRPFVAFDYSYETHSTDSKGNRTTQTHRYVVTAVQLLAWLPTLQVTPESIFSRIGNVLGFDDIELESEDFNRRFRVHAQDRKFACDVLNPRTMEALLRAPDLGWRIEGVDILTWDDGRLVPSTVPRMTAILDTVLAGIPSFVWKDHS